VILFGFDWDTHNVDHIGRHGVTPAEAEEVILGEPMEQGVGLRGVSAEKSSSELRLPVAF